MNCPHCAGGHIGWWRKTGASDLIPATCANCSKLSHVCSLAHGLMALLHEAAFWGSIICAVKYQQWWALLIYPV